MTAGGTIDPDELAARIDAASDAGRPRRATSCWLLDTLDQVDERVGQILLDRLRDPRITGSAIADTLREFGLRVAAQTVTRHKRGECGACTHVW